MTHTYPDWETCELPRRAAVDPTLPKPSWARFYEPVDLLRVFQTPDGVDRTLHMGVFQMIEDAAKAAGTTAWLPADAKGKKRSADGMWIIVPVST